MARLNAERVHLRTVNFIILGETPLSLLRGEAPRRSKNTVVKRVFCFVFGA